MRPIIKAMLIPFVRILQFILALEVITLVVGCVYGIVIWEAHLFDYSWQAFIIVNIVVVYIVTVWYCLEKRSKWWP